jgi:signal transduction histidine kinase
MGSTTKQPLHVLMVDDSENDAELILASLRKSGREIAARRVDNAQAMRVALQTDSWDLVLSDWSMPTFGGAAALEVLNSIRTDIPFIIVSGTVTEALAVEAMRSGARDWVLKDKLARLVPAVERELNEAEERRRAAEALRISEEQLRQSQKMEAIGGLAAGVAHDFNNLLSVIIGHADLLLGDLNPADPMHESVDEIRGAAARAAELTKQLLAFSRQQVLQPRLTDLNKVMLGMEKMLKRLIGEDVELAMTGAPDLGLAMVDPGQIEQVILNLAVNARDAMPRGGQLTIETANVSFDDDYGAQHVGARPGRHVMLAISDTGVGMDAATQARIFEPFFTTKETGKGTGLGLATVFGIVQQSGGTIWTYSEVGRGTTFKVYLPVAKGTRREAADRPPPHEEPVRRTETILLVEDEPAVRTLIRTVLQRQGYRVIDVSNGGEALLACEGRSERIDLLLTDVVMPRMSGPDLAKRLVTLRPTLKVLYMSGYTDRAIVNHGVLEPGVAFLQKPIAPKVLLRKVSEALDGVASPLSTPA